jgi:hypothetical protein
MTVLVNSEFLTGVEIFIVFLAFHGLVKGRIATQVLISEELVPRTADRGISNDSGCSSVVIVAVEQMEEASLAHIEDFQ